MHTEALCGRAVMQRRRLDNRWLHTGFAVSLYSGECEGCRLDIDAPQPCWFSMWRGHESDGAEFALPKSASLSYNEAARLMDGGAAVRQMAKEENGQA